MIELVVKNPKGHEEKYSFPKDEISIGRKSDNDVAMNDSEMSRYHAAIRLDTGVYYIHDLESTNGLYYKGERISQKLALHSGIEIKIGTHTLTFLGGDKESRPSSRFEGKAKPAGQESPQEIGAEGPGEEIEIEDKGHTFFLSAEELAKKAIGFEREGAKDAEVAVMAENVNKNLEILYNTGKDLLSVKDIKDISSMLIKTAEKVVQAERIVVQLKNSEGELETFDYKVSGDARNFKLSRTITNKVLNEGVAMMSSNALADDRFSSGASVIMQAIRAMLCVPIWKEKDCMGLIYIDNQHSLMGFKESDLQIISAVANQAAIGIDNIRLNESIQEEMKFRSNLERYHSPDVIDMIMKDPSSFAPQEKDVTILFSDIKGFTSMSERLTAVEVAEILNDYFDKMTEAIFANKGTLDKFIGDAIMAIFGAPFSYGNDAHNAVSAALDMLVQHEAIMAASPPDRQFGIRVGINSGRVVAGNIGSKKRVDYTVMGDAVNIASRLESKAEPNTVYVGESTYELVKDDFEFKEIGPSMLKGKAKSVMVYQAIGRKKI